MKPETIQKLRANVPELRELIEFIAQQAADLQTFDGLKELAFSERAYEVTARLRAYEKLTAILQPLIAPMDVQRGADPAEYVV